MSLEFIDPEEKARSEEYHLNVKVHVKKITYQDYQSKGYLGLVEEEMVFLEPLESTQRDLFFMAWLPDYEQDPVTKEIVAGHTEVVCKAGHPIYGYFKCSFHRADERFKSQPYLFVMTKSAEEELKNLNGKVLSITVLSQDQEHLGDYVKDYDLVNKKHIHTKLDDLSKITDGEMNV
jgi:hypothetical protein